MILLSDSNNNLQNDLHVQFNEPETSGSGNFMVSECLLRSQESRGLLSHRLSYKMSQMSRPLLAIK